VNCFTNGCPKMNLKPELKLKNVMSAIIRCPIIDFTYSNE